MNKMPVVEMQIRDLGQQIAGVVMAHHQEVQDCINAGIEKAAKGIENTIVDLAAKLAAEQFEKEVKNYFEWGDGHEVIRESVQVALKSFTKSLRTKGNLS